MREARAGEGLALAPLTERCAAGVRGAVVISSQSVGYVVCAGRSPQSYGLICLDCPLAVEAFFGVPGIRALSLRDPRESLPPTLPPRVIRGLGGSAGDRVGTTEASAYLVGHQVPRAGWR